PNESLRWGPRRAANARVGQADILLSDTELRSPLDGIVVERALEVGDLVSPGKTGFIVADTRRMKVVFGVPDSVQRTLTAGSPVVIHTEALPGRDFRGQVSKIAAKADDTSRLCDAEPTPANPDQSLRVGMTATAELVRASGATPPAVVPLAAIVPRPDEQDRFAVFVVERASNAAVVR